MRDFGEALKITQAYAISQNVLLREWVDSDIDFITSNFTSVSVKLIELHKSFLGQLALTTTLNYINSKS